MRTAHTCSLTGGPLDGVELPADFPTIERGRSTYFVIGTRSGLATYRVYAEGFRDGAYVPAAAGWNGYEAQPEGKG